MTRVKDDIIRLRQEGKSYNQIAYLLKCSKGTIAYHCGDNQKAKSYRRQKKRKNSLHPFETKLNKYKYRKINNKINQTNNIYTKHPYYMKIYRFNGAITMDLDYGVKEVIEKFTENPKCYLTGESIDIYNTKSYHFDHIIPISRGGTSSLDNLGITTKQANQAKSDMTPDEFFFLCKKVLANNGYSINKNPILESDQPTIVESDVTSPKVEWGKQ